MSKTHFTGLTWDHPRGYNALAAASERAISVDGGKVLTWEKQPLEGFESAPIGDLAARYDLLVLDHPHIGEAVALDCLMPLEELFDASLLQQWSDQTVGAAMSSYLWSGRHWALPLDVATQVMARRPDLCPTTPNTWEDVLRLSGQGGVAISVAGPHAILSVYSIAASLGSEPGGEQLLPDAQFREALAMLKRLSANAPAGSEKLNPIGLLEHMASHDDIALIPLVFGYVNYSRAQAGRCRVAFSDAPRSGGGSIRGSVLGGTGIAFSAHSKPDAALLSHIAWLMSAEAQSSFIPAHDGQPSQRAAYSDAAVNAAWGDFYAGTLTTSEGALVRPRHNGYIAFQTEASALVRNYLFDDLDLTQTMDRIRAAWRLSREHARGPLDATERTQP